MKVHLWECQCGAVVQAIGPRSLLDLVFKHERELHEYCINRTLEELTASPRYKKPEGATTVDPEPIAPGYIEKYGYARGLGVPTPAELRWLQDELKAPWFGDTRLPSEVAAHVKPRNNTRS